MNQATSGTAFDVFPPRKLAPLYRAAQNAALWKAFSQLGRLEIFCNIFFKTVAHSKPDPELLESVREDLRLTVCAIDSKATLDAAKKFAAFDRDVLIIWGTDCRFFPLSLGRRLAAAFPKSQLVVVENAMLFVSIDQPQAVALAIAAFVDKRIAA